MSGLVNMTCSRCGCALERTERYDEYECTACGTIFVMTDVDNRPSAMEQAEVWLGIGEWVKAGQLFWQAIQDNPRDSQAWFGLFATLTRNFDAEFVGQYRNYYTPDIFYTHDLVEIGVFQDEHCYKYYGDNPFVVLLRRALKLDVFDSEQIGTLIDFFYTMLDQYLGQVRSPYNLFRNENQWAEALKCYYILMGNDPAVLKALGYEYACDENMMKYLDADFEPKIQW